MVFITACRGATVRICSPDEPLIIPYNSVTITHPFFPANKTPHFAASRTLFEELIWHYAHRIMHLSILFCMLCAGSAAIRPFGACCCSSFSSAFGINAQKSCLSSKINQGSSFREYPPTYFPITHPASQTMYFALRSTHPSKKDI